MPKFAKHKNDIERHIIVALVEDLLSAGFTITVNDGDEDVLENSSDESAVFDAMSTTDNNRLYLTKGKLVGFWIYLVYGKNADVIHHYSSSINENVFARANKIAERFR